MILIFCLFLLINPLLFGDDENYVEANKLETPHHIQPEWYFLFAYGILRSVPNKAGGVLALALSIVVLFFLPSITNYKYKSKMFFSFNKISFFFFCVVFFILT